MDGGAWWATVHGVTKSQTRLSNFTFMGGLLGKDSSLQGSSINNGENIDSSSSLEALLLSLALCVCLTRLSAEGVGEERVSQPLGGCQNPRDKLSTQGPQAMLLGREQGRRGWSIAAEPPDRKSVV